MGPIVLDVGHESRYKNDVHVTLAKNLIRDMNSAALRVMGCGVRHLRLRALKSPEDTSHLSLEPDVVELVDRSCRDTGPRGAFPRA